MCVRETERERESEGESRLYVQLMNQVYSMYVSKSVSPALMEDIHHSRDYKFCTVHSTESVTATFM